jgi:hypothetical protein
VLFRLKVHLINRYTWCCRAVAGVISGSFNQKPMKGSALLLRLFLLFFLFLMFLFSLFAQPGGGGILSDSMDKAADELIIRALFQGNANHVPSQVNPCLLNTPQLPQNRFDCMDNFQAFEVSQARVNEQGWIESEFDFLQGKVRQ